MIYSFTSSTISFVVTRIALSLRYSGLLNYDLNSGYVDSTIAFILLPVVLINNSEGISIVVQSMSLSMSFSILSVDLILPFPTLSIQLLKARISLCSKVFAYFC
jgi:hypothetical protein